MNLQEIKSNDFFPTAGIYATSGRRTSFYVLCGIPGTGKSTYAKILQNKYVEGDCIIISRDEIRGNLLWDLRKEEKEKQKEKIKKLDYLVSQKVLDTIEERLSQRKYFGVIIDGCHTNYKILFKLLQFLNTFDDAIVNLLIVGYCDSPCNYTITNKKEGDYSDYDENFQHNAIPQNVLQRKRDEMRFLFTNLFEFMLMYIDYIHVLPNREPQK